MNVSTGGFAVSVQRIGWGGLKNGALLEKAELEFDVFLTGDRNLAFQQAVHRFEIAVIVLHAASTQLHDTLLLIPKLLELLPTVRSGELTDVLPLTFCQATLRKHVKSARDRMGEVAPARQLTFTDDLKACEIE